MDPLSILISTITALEVTIKVSEKVARLLANGKHFSNELLSVSNDVTDFRLVLTAVEENAVEERRLMALPNPGLGSRALSIEDITRLQPQQLLI